jgi:hypothetical protein
VPCRRAAAAQTRTFPIDDLKPGMVATGRTVFEGDRLDEFKAHILGVLRNTIGPRRNLILARLEGGPLANTGVIAGMSGSPVYIDGRLVGAVSYSLGQFAKEPIAGITPFDEMVEAATLPAPRRQAARVELTTPITQEGLRAALSAGVCVDEAVCREPERRAAAWRRRERRHRHHAAPDCDADYPQWFRSRR